MDRRASPSRPGDAADLPENRSNPQGAVRYDWAQMRHYWETHASARTTFDAVRDPDRLDNVCQTGAPRAVNRYYHRGQMTAFLSLLDRLPAPERGATALDVGCGTGRWSRLLNGRGYSVTGVDLQPEVIAENQRQYPSIRFVTTSIQDFESEPVALVSTVTVLQHLPHEEQERAVATIARLVQSGGHAIVLENISDWDSPTVFSRTRSDWLRLFESAGFATVESRGYDFSPTLRSYYAVTRPIRLRGLPRTAADLEAPPTRPAQLVSPRGSALLTADRAARVVASYADRVIDPILFAMQPTWAGHVAALFRRS